MRIETVARAIGLRQLGPIVRSTRVAGKSGRAQLDSPMAGSEAVDRAAIGNALS
jgi:hypothetical protein